MEAADAQPRTGLQELADSFMSMIPSLKMYTEYVNKFSLAMQALSACQAKNSTFAKTLKVFSLCLSWSSLSVMMPSIVLSCLVLSSLVACSCVCGCSEREGRS
jgi:hypothetical protein